MRHYFLFVFFLFAAVSENALAEEEYSTSPLIMHERTLAFVIPRGGVSKSQAGVDLRVVAEKMQHEFSNYFANSPKIMLFECEIQSFLRGIDTEGDHFLLGLMAQQRFDFLAYTKLHPNSQVSFNLWNADGFSDAIYIKTDIGTHQYLDDIAISSVLAILDILDPELLKNRRY